MSSELVRLTMENAERVGVTLVPGVGANARAIAAVPDLQGKTFDSILLLGPLYHLLNAEERLQTINGCLSLLNSGGVLFAAFVTVYAHMRDMASKAPGRLVRDLRFYEQYMEDGKY